MELRVLRYFLAVAQEESINRAAEALHITQPTLSRQMAQLEEEVGVTLFSRGARRITLPSEGLLLKRRAEEILSLVDRTERELGEQEEQIEGRVVIGCGELAAVRAADLSGRVLHLPGRANVRNELLNWFGDALREEQVLFTGNLSTNSAVMVERGLACAVVIEGSLPFLDREKLVLRPLDPSLYANSIFA